MEDVDNGTVMCRMIGSIPYSWCVIPMNGMEHGRGCDLAMRMVQNVCAPFDRIGMFVTLIADFGSGKRRRRLLMSVEDGDGDVVQCEREVFEGYLPLAGRMCFVVYVEKTDWFSVELLC